MGQDYVARKQAKKQRKRMGRDAETGRKTKKRRKDEGFDIAGDDDGLQLSTEAQKRKRKKGNNVSLRISRSLCYKEPQLTEDDRAWDGTWENGEDTEHARLPSMMQGLKESGYDSDVEEQLSKLPAAQQQQVLKPQKQQQQQQQQEKAKPKPKLSTGVNLLDPVKAAKESQQRSNQQQRRQQQQQLDDVITANPTLQTLSTEVSPFIARCMAKLGFYEPTPIQNACWPAAVAGRDLRGIAEPGSGKTLAYLLPGLARVLAAGAADTPSAAGSSASSSSGLVQPQVLILAPSRELAQQVYNNCKSLFAVTAVSTCCIYGGVPKDEQITKLQERQPVVLVATPGRLLDLIDSQAVGLQKVQVVVLDEADKMLSVGFEPQLQRLRGLLLDNRVPAAGQQQQSKKHSKKKQQYKGELAAAAAEAAGAGSQRPQVLLFTATFPAAVQETATAWLSADAIEVVCNAGADSISRSITQVVHVCAEPKKPAKVLKHLAAIKEASAGLRNPPRVLVFANKIKTVTFIHKTLTDEGYRAVMLHGKRSQAERTAAVTDFKSGKAQILVASDVASRGLDIRGLPYVVNYDFPSNLETYIHRVGRTGRLAAEGHAYSFFTRPLAKLAGPVVELLQQHDQAVDPNLVQLAEAWKQVEAALAAQGKEVPNTSAAAAAVDAEGDDEQELAAVIDLTADDLQEGLPASTQQQEPPQQQQQQQHPDTTISGKKKRKQQPGDVLMVPQTAAAAAALGGSSSTAAVPAATPAVLEFVPSKTFVGAKAGMVFKKGPRGQGYYPDSVAAASAEKQRQWQQQLQRLALQQVQKQQKAATKKQQKAKQQQQGLAVQEATVSNKQGLSKSQKRAADALPLLPGLARKQRQQQQFFESNLSDDDGAGVLDKAGVSDDKNSSSDDEQRGGSFGNRLQEKAGGKRKALPGRLRKKLVKQKAKQG